MYSPNCTALENGFVTLNNCKLIIYCPSAGLNGKGLYDGFRSSTVTSIRATYNNRNKNVVVKYSWGGIDDSSVISRDTNTQHETYTNNGASESNQDFEVTSSNFVLSRQGEAKSSNYSCFYLNYNDSSGVIDLYSLTISFTCN